MNEHITEALVLKTKTWANKNKQISLYTKDLGRLKVKAISGGKTTSKLSPHLDVLNLSTVRLINKNNFLIADALTKDRFEKVRESEDYISQGLKTVSLIDEITPFNMVDNRLWYYLISSFKKARFNDKELLKILGYDPTLAKCMICDKKDVKYFVVSEQDYVCEKCEGKINNEDKFLIKTYDKEKRR